MVRKRDRPGGFPYRVKTNADQLTELAKAIRHSCCPSNWGIETVVDTDNPQASCEFLFTVSYMMDLYTFTN